VTGVLKGKLGGAERVCNWNTKEVNGTADKPAVALSQIGKELTGEADTQAPKESKGASLEGCLYPLAKFGGFSKDALPSASPADPVPSGGDGPLEKSNRMHVSGALQKKLWVILKREKRGKISSGTGKKV